MERQVLLEPVDISNFVGNQEDRYREYYDGKGDLMIECSDGLTFAKKCYMPKEIIEVNFPKRTVDAILLYLYCGVVAKPKDVDDLLLRFRLAKEWRLKDYVVRLQSSLGAVTKPQFYLYNALYGTSVSQRGRRFKWASIIIASVFGSDLSAFEGRPELVSGMVPKLCSLLFKNWWLIDEEDAQTIIDNYAKEVLN